MHLPPEQTTGRDCHPLDHDTPPEPTRTSSYEPPSWRLGDRILHSITVIAAFLTILGVVLTIWAMLLSRRQVEVLKDLASTAYIGRFPNNFDELHELLRSASNNILILTDGVGYGHFSSHKEFKTYMSILEGKYNDEEVQISTVVYGKENWDTYVAPLFDRFTDDDLARFKEDSRQRPYWAELDKRMKNAPDLPEGTTFSDARITTMKSFIEQLWADEELYYQRMPGRTFRLNTTRPVPVFAWIVDDKEAIFSFLGVNPHRPDSDDGSQPALRTPRERYHRKIMDASFRTTDGNVIDALKNIAFTYAPELVKEESQGSK